MFKPSQLLFAFTLLLGVAITVSSSSWFIAWMGLELNLLSFIPLLSSTENRYSSESTLKYFLIQALGSSVILASAPCSLFIQNLSYLVILVALLLKVGAAPLHYWFPPVMQGVSWPQGITLMTIQKIAPITMMSFLMSDLTMLVIMVSSIMSGVVGALGGLNQTFTRKIISYSSINHMGWMLAAMLFNEQMWTIYFISYAVVASSVVFILHSNQIFHFNQLSTMNLYSKPLKLNLFLSLLSMGGMPPLLGFLPKWMVMQEFIFSGASILWLSALLFSALLTLFYYLRIAISSMVFSSPKTKMSLIPTSSNYLLMAAAINFSPLLYPFILLLIY
uniref:NADH-ubiquinone oxidoreductase chain 2 n=1 Tax=Paratya australiensis TaxID=159741 RepID=A0A0U2DW98_PARAS|nr:NADH dehydrogenase subunit 2 [Paratya australiensis]AKQ09522.1 NADH dehydrogenase subunit 2 [Paratya australiensis]